MWDYIKQWNGFLNTSLETLSCTEFAIYARLFQINNERGRNEYFQAKYSVLAYFTGLSIKSVSLCINTLQQKGFIEVKKGKKNSPSEFKLIPLYENNVDVNKAKNFRLNGNEKVTNRKRNGNEKVTNRKRNGNEKVTNRKRNGNEFDELPNLDEANEEATSESIENAKNDAFPSYDCLKEKEKGKEKEKESNARAKKTAEPKISYAEAVTMTEAEYATLLGKLKTNGAVEWCIEKLNNYKLSNGKTYKSDFRAILNWVIGEYETQQAKKQKSINGITTPFSNPQYEMGQRAIAMIDAMGDDVFG